MKNALLLLWFGLFANSIGAASTAIIARDAKVDNVQLHYLTAGHGPATVILLHGFAETSRMWRPIIPLLAEKFTVIAPDLPGIGDSSIPAKTGMLIAAEQIHVPGVIDARTQAINLGFKGVATLTRGFEFFFGNAALFRIEPRVENLLFKFINSVVVNAMAKARGETVL